MKHIKILLVLLILPFLTSCEKNELKDVEFLVGTWKVEGRESYESWEQIEGKLSGESYKIKEGIKKVSESLKIESKDNQIVYTATVFNQNQGKGISFVLNTDNKQLFSFENPNHDFPNKIQYKVLSEKELEVHVLGNDGKGFSYKLIKKD
ncbi:DUF6265 family protein [Pseudotenacibaculum sp. MALMAid0570]|uniref:DUF6265 family protein n=1 Tax=Pseudotenacibaculum sp. MALMAid0570 TaxID=3143938 RepID=UPI0032DFD3A0